MTWKIGRCGTDVTLGDPSEWNTDGDRASVAGFLSAATQADVNVLREQLLGYADNPDEEIVPVTWTVDSRVDGFYRVVGVQVSEDPGHRVAFTLPYRLELERVSGFAAPVFESILLGALRTNVHSITTEQAFHALPLAVEGYSFPGVAVTSSSDIRPGVDGTHEVRHNAPDGVLYDTTANYFLAPADWYDNACKIEVGTTLRTVVGRQIQNLPVNWRLSNGLLRLTPVAGALQFDLSAYDGTQWDTAVRFQFTTSTNTTFDAPHTVTVLRNSVEETAIRLSWTAESTLERQDVDFTIRRGSLFVAGFAAAPAFTGPPRTWRIKRTVNEAATAFVGGIRATGNDAAGNRYVLGSPHAVTNDLTVGQITMDTADVAMSFVLGISVDGPAEPHINSGQQILYQYYAAQSERVVVAAR